MFLLSNVYATKSHWLDGKKKSVACHGTKTGCTFCKKLPPRSEYYYFAMVNGERGILRVPATVFFSMNQLEKVMKGGKTKRDYSWIVLKDGEGKETKYTCSKDEPIPKEESAKEDMEKNNATLDAKIKAYENRLEQNYAEFVKDYSGVAVSADVEVDQSSDVPF